jgi:hypothetical protein
MICCQELTQTMPRSLPYWSIFSNHAVGSFDLRAVAGFIPLKPTRACFIYFFSLFPSLKKYPRRWFLLEFLIIECLCILSFCLPLMMLERRPCTVSFPSLPQHLFTINGCSGFSVGDGNTKVFINGSSGHFRGKNSLCFLYILFSFSSIPSCLPDSARTQQLFLDFPFSAWCRIWRTKSWFPKNQAPCSIWVWLASPIL